MESVTVNGRRDLIDEISSREYVDAKDKYEFPISKQGIDELWDIWEYRYRNGSYDYLIFVPEWLPENEFGQRWPYMFAEVEYDDDSKGAVLFRDVRLIDPSIVENQVWTQVSLSDTLERLDISGDSDHIDDPGKVWIARSLFTAFEMGDDV